MVNQTITYIGYRVKRHSRRFSFGSICFFRLKQEGGARRQRLSASSAVASSAGLRCCFYEDIEEWAVPNNADYIALSFVQRLEPK